jgi:Xaa-Pro aminopeptidase
MISSARSRSDGGIVSPNSWAVGSPGRILRVLGKLGVAFSETVLITPTGCETLTRVERQLLVR